ncbi:hypothetical protein [Macromonas nakdongensis]|uniref:hypothetical protein n=1 Tax=Macromonas nakdongensis TaxID=1843082 RepID=UPI000C342647|nr:hypothetical protein [Macromonas nakdongensis]
MTTLPQRLRQMADHTGLDAVAELLREAADTIERREAVIRILERDALAEQPAEQEPVAWVVDMNGTESLEWHSDVQADLIFGTAVQPLYTAPHPAKRKPLTREQVLAIVQSNPDTTMAIRMTEAAHGITGEPKT